MSHAGSDGLAPAPHTSPETAVQSVPTGPSASATRPGLPPSSANEPGLPPASGQSDVDAVVARAHAAMTPLPREDLEGRREVLERANHELRSLLEAPLAPTDGPTASPTGAAAVAAAATDEPAGHP